MGTLTKPDLQVSSPLGSSWFGAISIRLLFGLIIWIAHFLDSAKFGLYEDDWNRVAKTMGIDWHGLWVLIQANAMPGPSQGRPLHPTLIYFLSFVGFKCGGLGDVYVIAFIILFINALLFHSFLRRVFHDDRFAFLGALAFCVFPADTTQSFLTHGLGIQPAMTLLLIAFHCYLSGWKKASYVAIILSLFTYETVFLVFAAAPLLLRPRAKRELRKHCTILVVILLCAVVIRISTARKLGVLSHIGLRELLLAGTNVVAGPLTCVAMYIYRPIEELYEMTRHNAGVVSLCVLVFACIVVSPLLLNLRSSQTSESPASNRVRFASVDARRQLTVGTVMLLLSYPLALTTTGFSLAGRGTRVHSPAILGGSILCAWASSLLLCRPIGRFGKYTAAIGVACFYGLLVCFGLTVQRDYVLGWQEERGFWTDLVTLCPSLRDGDVILVEPTGLRDTRQLLFLRKDRTGIPETRQIKSLDLLYGVLPDLYDFPPEWKAPSRVYRLPLDWEDKIFAGGDALRPLSIEAGYSYVADSNNTVEASHVIFLDTRNGQLTRKGSILNRLDGEVIPLKNDSGVPVNLTKTAVYQLLIFSKDHSTTSYLVK